jgi:crotonobetainyl-CoA:carnitine CoA-transferase CaiB-like acyl-CoA transferase
MAEPTPDTAPLNALLETIDLSPKDFGNVVLTGDEKQLPSPHRLAMAGASVIALQAAAAAAVWKARTGRSQTITVDMHRAAIGLDPGEFAKQNGYPIDTRSHAREPVNGFFRTKDNRHFWVVGTYVHLRNGALELLDCANTKEAMSQAIAKWNADDLEQVFFEKKMIGATARSPEEWRAHPQGQWLLDEPVIRITKIAESAPEPLKPAARPLSGVRVMNMAHVIAGPVVARTLAEQGADAMRLSSPALPDSVNQIIETGTGQRSAYCDLLKPEDQEQARELAKTADIFVESWRPGAMERRGMSVTDVAKIRPGIIYVSVSCFGHRGPWAPRGGFDQIGQTVTGVAVTEGGKDSPRLVPTTLLNDYITAYLGAAGAMAALLRRAREGGSYHVTVSLCRSAMWVQSLGLWPVPQVGHLKPRADELMVMKGPFGDVERIQPIPIFSETKPSWDYPPQPLGAAKAEWLPRD